MTDSARVLAWEGKLREASAALSACTGPGFEPSTRVQAWAAINLILFNLIPPNIGNQRDGVDAHSHCPQVCTTRVGAG